MLGVKNDRNYFLLSSDHDSGNFSGYFVCCNQDNNRAVTMSDIKLIVDFIITFSSILGGLMLIGFMLGYILADMGDEDNRKRGINK